MNTIAYVVLIFLAIVVALQVMRGTFVPWLRAKFLNQPSAPPSASAAATSSPQVTVT